MKSRTIGMAALALTGVLAGGCAQNGSPLQTASVAPDKMAATAQPKVDPACASLASQIDTLRKEGAVERLEKAATGKTASVQVKRASLVKQAELNKANADFQTRCGPQLLRPQSAQAAPAAAQVAPIATAASATTSPGAVKSQAAAASTTAPAAAAAAQAVAKP